MEPHDKQDERKQQDIGAEDNQELSRKIASLEQALEGMQRTLGRMTEQSRAEEAGTDAGEPPAVGASGQEAGGPEEQSASAEPGAGGKGEPEAEGAEAARPPGEDGSGEEAVTAAGEASEQPAIPEGEASAAEEAGAPDQQAGTPDEEAGAAGGQESEEKAEQGPGESEKVSLFDESAGTLQNWKKVGAGELEHRDQQLLLHGGGDLGLAYYDARRFSDFRLKVEYRLSAAEAPMTVAVRFRDPKQPVPDREDPERQYRYDNQAFVAAHTGFQVRLGNSGGPAGTFTETPGSESGKKPSSPAQLKSEDWNELEIEARGDDYIVRLNGAESSRFTNSDPWRGKSSESEADSGYIGFLCGEPRPPAGKPKPRAAAGPLSPLASAPGVRSPARPTSAEPPLLTVRRVEVETLGPAPREDAEKKDRARKDLAALHEEVRAALARLKAKDAGLEGALKKAYGYAVLPSVGRASLVLGGARGYGVIFEQEKPIGFTRATQLTVGVQVGGHTFTELVLFGSKESLKAFKSSPMVFNANLSAVFIRGASGTTNFRDVTAHAYSRGGMLLEASLGGQKFRFMREDEAVRALAKIKERSAKARETFARVGHAASGVFGKISAKAAALRGKHPNGGAQ